MMQVAPRAWPADAVHDTVAAVVRGDRRSAGRCPSSVAERLIALARRMARAAHPFRGWPVVDRAHRAGVRRDAGAARRRAPAARGGARRRSALPRDASAGARRVDDPWRTAERLIARGTTSRRRRTRCIAACCASLAQREQRARSIRRKTSGDYARELRARGSPMRSRRSARSRAGSIAPCTGEGGCDAGLARRAARAGRALRAAGAGRVSEPTPAATRARATGGRDRASCSPSSARSSSLLARCSRRSRRSGASVTRGSRRTSRAR